MVINRDKFNFLVPAELSVERWHTLLALGTPKSVKSGTMIYEQSSVMDELICLTEGAVKIVYFFDSGNEKLYESVSAPAVLGAEALWQKKSGIYPSIVALSDAAITAVPIEAAEEFVARDTEMLIALFQCVRNSMSISRIRSACAAPMSVLQKVAFAIEFLREADKDGDGYTAVTHEELAQLIGVSRANATTALAELAQMGLIAKKRGKVKILNNGKLMELLDNPF